MGTVKLVPDYLKLEKFKLSSVHQEIANINQQVQISAMTLPTHNTPPALQNILSNVSDLVKELDFDVKNFLDADSRGAALTFIEKIRNNKEDFENIVSIGTQFAGIGMLMSKSVTFHRLPNFKKRVYSFRSKPWLHKVNGRYPNVITRSIDKFIKAQPKNIATKYLHSQMGFNKGFTTPSSYVKGHLLGLPKNSTLAGMKTITKSVTKRFGAINIAATTFGEVLSLSKKYNNNTATFADYGSTTSNIIIKSTASYAGSVVGATALSWLGPPGVIIGGMAGGIAGAKAGDYLAGKVDYAIHHFDEVKQKADHALSDAKKIGSATLSKGKDWVKGWFK